MSERPFGSYDWNGDGKYDFFDKVTDQYVYDKVSKYEPEPKVKPARTQRTYNTNNNSNSDSEIPWWIHVMAWIIGIAILYHMFQ